MNHLPPFEIDRPNRKRRRAQDTANRGKKRGSDTTNLMPGPIILDASGSVTHVHTERTAPSSLTQEQPK